jgi:sugar phosphate isomerase/epimerase
MYSRRDFGKIALAGLPASLALAAKIDSQVSGVRLGVQTYSFRDIARGDDAVDVVIKAMTEVGLGECELSGQNLEPSSSRPRFGGPGGGPGARPPDGGEPRPKRDMNNPEAAKRREELRQWRLTTPLDHFTAVREKFDNAGINIFAYNLTFDERFTDEEIDRGFEIAKALGAKVITTSGKVSMAKRVAPFADKHRMSVAVHGHSNVKDPNEFATPESFATAMAMSKYFKVNLDIGHFTAAGYDAVAYIKEHHDHISNLHLKDRKKDQGPNVPWGEGDVPIKEVLVLLKEKKWAIPAYIEYEYKGMGTPVEEVKKCYEYAKKALA